MYYVCTLAIYILYLVYNKHNGSINFPRSIYKYMLLRYIYINK